MLVLNRKLGESIILNDSVEIKIVEIRDGQVKLGFEADESVVILRKELYDDVKNENQEALKSEEDIELLKKLNRKMTSK